MLLCVTDPEMSKIAVGCADCNHRLGGMQQGRCIGFPSYHAKARQNTEGVLRQV